MKEIIFQNVETVGAFIIDNEHFVFSIGENKTREYLGITRLGGHIESGETILEALERELLEEATTKIEVISSTKCYYKKSWDSEELEEINIVINGVVPALVVGNENRSTVLFWGKILKQPTPANEAQGIIYLPINVIKELSIIEDSGHIFQLTEFKIVTHIDMDYKLKVKPGVHLITLNQMIKNDDVLDFIRDLQ